MAAGSIAEAGLSCVRTVYSLVAERETLCRYAAAAEGSYEAGCAQAWGKGLAIASQGLFLWVWAGMVYLGAQLAVNGALTGGRFAGAALSAVMGAE